MRNLFDIIAKPVSRSGYNYSLYCGNMLTHCDRVLFTGDFCNGVFNDYFF